MKYGDDIFDMVIATAQKSVMQHRHGAIITQNGEILGQGYNHQTTHLCHQYSCHAEVAAIRSVPKKFRHKLKDATLIVVRVGNDGNVKLSKPCTNCSEYIEKNGIKKVFYST